MDSFLLDPKEDSLLDKITTAGVTGMYHTVHHAHSYRSANRGSKQALVIFPDFEISKVAQKQHPQLQMFLHHPLLRTV